MNLTKVQEAWEQLGQKAPLRSMLPASVCGKISKVEEYFAFGQSDTEHMMKLVSSLGITVGTRRALDFGCGLGRTSQALAGYFEEVYGIDIAPSILALARSYNQHPDKCKYVLNSSNDLAMFHDNSIDFACSFGALQHVGARMCERYIQDFLRILVPGGVLLFSLPSLPKKTGMGLLLGLLPSPVINLYRRHKYGRETYVIRPRQVRKMIERAGGIVVDCRVDHTNTVSEHLISLQFCVSK